mgnify:CR=1 FL=1
MPKHPSSHPSTTPARSGLGGVFAALIGAAASVLLVVRYGESWLRSIILYLSNAGWARRVVTGFGPAWSVASRFIAGESVDQAIGVAQTLNRAGMSVALDFLGESVSDAREAADARDHILELIEQIHLSGVDAYISVKLSQLGLKIDENLALANMRALLEAAQRHNIRVRIDMEESALVNITLDIYRTLRHGEGFDNVGVVIQSCLYRSEDDVRALIDEGAWVRLVKGAYKEPASVAYVAKSEVDAAFVRLTEAMLSPEAHAKGAFLSVASHDDAMIEAALDFARLHQISPRDFEFQMLYGIRRERQRALAAQGWQMRIYVPYGTAWYPYFMRRLAERPANLWFFVSTFFQK